MLSLHVLTIQTSFSIFPHCPLHLLSRHRPLPPFRLPERTRADLSEEQQKQYALEIQEHLAAEVAKQLEDFR